MIKSIHIENFKSIEKQSINFDDFSMLIGENGSGKTNLIHAISFIKRVALGPNITEAHKFAAIPSELSNKRSNTNVIKISISLVNGDDTEYKLSYEFSLGIEEPIKNLFISYEKFEEKKNNNSKIIFERKGDNIISEPLGGSSNFKIDGLVSAMSVVDHTSVQKVKKILSSIYISEADISASGSMDPLEKKVVRIITLLHKKDEERYKKFETVVKKLIPALYSLTDVSEVISKVVSSSSGNEYQVLFREKSMEGSLSMKASSHGDLRTYYILALMFYAEEHSTIIIEELENGIHTKRAKDLIDFLEKIANQQNKQLILSSHNPRLIGKVPYEKLILVERSSDGGSIYKKLIDSANIHMLEKFLEQGGEISELL